MNCLRENFVWIQIDKNKILFDTHNMRILQKNHNIFALKEMNKCNIASRGAQVD